MPERLECEVLQKARYINTLTFTFISAKKSSNFYEILYTAADFELDKRHVIKNEKVALNRLRVRQNVFLVVSLLHFGAILTVTFHLLGLFMFCVFGFCVLLLSLVVFTVLI